MILPHSQIRQIVRGSKVEHRIPARPGEDRCRIAVGDSVGVRPPGETALARIQVTAVERERLGKIDPGAARREGFGGRDPVVAWARAWLERNDRAYAEALHHPVHPANAEDVMDRIAANHAHREVWVVRFVLDPSAPPRMLHRHSERGYTISPGEAMADEPEAVDEFTQARITREASVRNEEVRAAVRERWRRTMRERQAIAIEAIEAMGTAAREAGDRDAAERMRQARRAVARVAERLGEAAASGSGSGDGAW